MKTYSVIEFDGSIQSVVEPGIEDINVASARARGHSANYSDRVVAVVDDDTDTAIMDQVFNNDRKLSRDVVSSVVYGLGRFM